MNLLLNILGVFYSVQCVRSSVNYVPSYISVQDSAQLGIVSLSKRSQLVFKSSLV